MILMMYKRARSMMVIMMMILMMILKMILRMILRMIMMMHKRGSMMVRTCPLCQTQQPYRWWGRPTEINMMKMQSWSWSSTMTTFSMLAFIAGEVNSSLDILRSAPVSILQIIKFIIMVILVMKEVEWWWPREGLVVFEELSEWLEKKTKLRKLKKLVALL